MITANDCLMCETKKAETLYYHGSYYVCSDCIQDYNQERQVIENLLSLPAGYSIQNEGMACIRQLEDGYWAVEMDYSGWPPEDKLMDEEEIFQDLNSAISLFLKRQ